jgi:hypothetical protein
MVDAPEIEKPSEPAPVLVDDALETLVNQFADPMSFLRELVQNALDAGSPEIDVRLELEREGEADHGVLVIHVDDYGEGMTREIIETKLTRLFSSTKEGDYTKIGRFGIGFVSVFAIAPDAVCVDTSRGGESWRVLFERDRSFSIIPRDTPVDGTKIRVLKSIPVAELASFRQRARQTVVHWCKHAAAEIRFDGEPINLPLDLDVPCRVAHEEEGTRIVVGYTPDRSSAVGFYNKGLTLWEHRSPPGEPGEVPPLIAAKVSSRYLEHTLTRDNVLRDAEFDKAMARVQALVAGPLRTELLRQIALAVKEGPESAALEWLHGTAAQALLVPDEPAGLADAVLFASLSGAPLTARDVRRARRAGTLYFDDAPSPLLEPVTEQGGVVVRGRPDGGTVQLLARLTGEPPRQLSRALCRPLPARSAAEQAAFEPLRRALERLLEADGARVQAVALGHLAHERSSLRKRVAITQTEAFALTDASEADQLDRSLLSRRRALVVNADHPAVRPLVALSGSEPELAAYLLLKLVLLRHERPAGHDARLALESLAHRDLRTAARRPPQDPHG